MKEKKISEKKIQENFSEKISEKNFEKKNSGKFSEKNFENFRAKIFFQNNLSERSMPWLNEKNAYKIWLSEIILQQTTVAQGTPYYNRFVERYPTIKNLAGASNDEVMKNWEGLGYYSRARNLHHTAKTIANDYDGKFPETYAEIIKLKGIGAYTAAAIASFAYNLPYAVLDGNVFRVLARFFGIDIPIDATDGKKFFMELAQHALDKNNPATYNQAIMNFGATVCTPSAPDCKNCALMPDCNAFNTQRIKDLPVKEKKMVKKNLFFQYIVMDMDGEVFLRKRTDKDIWQDLYEFVLVETDDNLIDGSTKEKKFIEEKLNYYFKSDYTLIRKSKIYKQVLTHRNVFATFWEVKFTGQKFILPGNDFFCTPRKYLSQYAFPKIIDNYLNETVRTLF